MKFLKKLTKKLRDAFAAVRGKDQGVWRVQIILDGEKFDANQADALMEAFIYMAEIAAGEDGFVGAFMGFEKSEDEEAK